MMKQPTKNKFIALFIPLVSSTIDLSLGMKMLSPYRQLFVDEKSHHHYDFNMSAIAAVYKPQKPYGDKMCPCLTQEQRSKFSFTTLIDPQEEFLLLEGFKHDSDNTNNYNSTDAFLATFGVNCAPHELQTKGCSRIDDCTSIVPVPASCDKSYCHRSFCYIDPENCDLLHKPSAVFEDMYFSYATCGFMDSFTHTERIKVLQEQVINIALNSNTGGWMGAYNPEGSFAINQNWHGPIVDFIKSAAVRGGFMLNITRPPKWLQEESKKFFGGSSFDYCVYATSLGYLDMCISSYTITAKRATVTPFFELYSDPVYLIIFSAQETASVRNILASLFTIFKPFSPTAWVFIVLVCLPVLGLLMLYHEYGSCGGMGSAFPDKKYELVTDHSTGEEEILLQEVHVSEHVIHALYTSYLAFFSGSYEVCVTTLGGKLNLLAILSFILLVIEAYTANLAAILTQADVHHPVASIDEAVMAGYNFCADRKLAERIINIYNVDPELFVPDPVDIGGDGQPGFNCPNCRMRQRTFDFMKQTHNDNSLYCNAAFSSLDDLLDFHQNGMHCNKTKVGVALTHTTVGLPVYSKVSEGMNAWLYKMKNDGLLDAKMKHARPESSCPVTEGEGISLSVLQLTGIWIITLTLAVAGVLAKFLQFLWKDKQIQQRCSGRRCNQKVSIQSLQSFNQWGNSIEYDIRDRMQHEPVLPNH